MTIKNDYEEFYSNGNWKQNKKIEKLHIKYYLKILGKKVIKILDIGCGTGLHTHILTELGYNSTGIDIAASAIKKAQERYQEIKFYVQNASDINLNETFDLLYASGFSLFNTHNYSNMNKLLSHWSSLLKANGSILITSKTNFSGKAPTGWIYHTNSEIHLMYQHNDFNTTIYYIHSKLGYLILIPFIGTFLIKPVHLISKYIIPYLFRIPVKTIVIMTKHG